MKFVRTTVHESSATLHMPQCMEVRLLQEMERTPKPLLIS
jgi:hypothetical protein